jgi:hypothetical protein
VTGSVTWTGSVTFSDTGYANTGVATMTLTPTGGTSTLPALVNGTPGLPPVIDSVTVIQVAYGTTAPAPVWTLVSPGGAGTASHYTLTVYVNSGQQGATGPSTNISTAPDVEGGPVGSGTDGYTLYYVNADAKWKISAPKVPAGPYICLNSAFTAVTSSSATSATIATIGTPALPYAWRPIVSAAFLAGGTINTHIDGAVYLGSSTGQQVGYGMGGSGTSLFPVRIGSAFGASISGSSTYGQVAAGASATFFLQALQTASTTDSWSTQNTNGHFTILAVPT